MAKLNENAPEDYRGLDRFVARKKIVAELEELGLHREDRASQAQGADAATARSAVIEPYLTDQWYVKIAPLAEPALKAVEEGRTKFVPENWSKTYYEWMRNIKDWCVSRQLWWGHRIPAWYDESGSIYVGRDEAEVRKKHSTRAIASSRRTRTSSTPGSLPRCGPSPRWAGRTRHAELKKFYPTSVLVTGFDIIFFWVARMMMMGLKFMGDVPFKHVYITGLIRDENGDEDVEVQGKHHRPHRHHRWHRRSTPVVAQRTERHDAAASQRKASRRRRASSFRKA